MNIYRFGFSTVALALLAFVVLMPMKSWALDIPAPQINATINLGVNDPPASATLDGWYCTDRDLRDATKELLDPLMGVVGGGGVEARNTAARLVYLVQDKGWPYNIMQTSPVKTGLDAPPGGSKVYNFKCCYTKSELDLVEKTITDALVRVVGWEGIPSTDIGSSAAEVAAWEELIKWAWRE